MSVMPKRLVSNWMLPELGGSLPETQLSKVVLPEPDRRRMQREDWGFVHQNPRDGLRMRVSGGANVAEPLMNLGQRHYGKMRKATIDWLERVELDTRRIDDRPANFSGGMQQRIQVARNLIHEPRLVFMDEPTGGLDVSVQAKLLDLLRELVRCCMPPEKLAGRSSMRRVSSSTRSSQSMVALRILP